ncbi:hypothetical protein BDV06DRAFT_230498 [Aspergillus oleicola]
MSFISHTRILVVLQLGRLGLSQIVNGPEYNHAHGGPPANYFTAAATMPVAALQSTASQLNGASGDGTYLMNSESSSETNIYQDWASFREGAAIVWTADMDVDCDGIDSGCRGNEDGLPETNWGEMAAYEVPWIVIPDDYLEANQDVLPGNNIGAVICNGRMFYGILGDSNGDDPQLTGEASWLMARTCFPHEDLNGGEGHMEFDVTYIVFLGQQAVLPDSAINDNYVTDFGALQSIGDRLVNALLLNIGLLSGGPTRKVVMTASATSSTATYISTPASGPSTSMSTKNYCLWLDHCLGATCSIDDDCSVDLACIGGLCSVDKELDEEKY